MKFLIMPMVLLAGIQVLIECHEPHDALAKCLLSLLGGGLIGAYYGLEKVWREA